MLSSQPRVEKRPIALQGLLIQEMLRQAKLTSCSKEPSLKLSSSIGSMASFLVPSRAFLETMFTPTTDSIF